MAKSEDCENKKKKRGGGEKKEGENRADKSWAVSMKGSDAVFVEIESISLGWFNDTYAGNERGMVPAWISRWKINVSVL